MLAGINQKRLTPREHSARAEQRPEAAVVLFICRNLSSNKLVATPAHLHPPSPALALPVPHHIGRRRRRCSS